MLISIIIRTLNEETYLADLLKGIDTQALPENWSVETVIVDSGSTDRTLEIAAAHNCRITHISKDQFSFGGSLNIGCAFSTGEVLVFVSGHCVPVDGQWLQRLVEPLKSGICSYTYGRQFGSGPTRFSESRVFLKYYSTTSLLPQTGFFANNANAALPRTIWEQYRFDETLTGLEDMHLAKRLVNAGHKIGYVAEAGVYHIHDESWEHVLNRFEREGAALTEIMPESGLSFLDFIECTTRSIVKDSYAALKQKVFLANFTDICIFRTLQYWGSYRGTRFARMVAAMRRKTYFHPDKHFEKQGAPTHEGHRTPTHESPQQQGPRQELQGAGREASVPLDSR
jgi:glycosyltransferase involved in cell wall biosynthesis